MLESELEQYLIGYLDLIEPGLKVKGNQVNCHGKRVDILCEDRYGMLLIIEVKRLAVRKDVAQLLDYAGHFIVDRKLPVRVMLIAFRIPQNFKASLDYFGFEYKELSEPDVAVGLGISIDSQETARNAPSAFNKTLETHLIGEQHATSATDGPVRNATRQNMASRIKKGNLFDQARRVMELLLKANGPVQMNQIKEHMSLYGYTSKTYYDVLNALLDEKLVIREKSGRSFHYSVIGQ